MGKRVLSVIVDEIKLAKYFSISVDSTPDMMHVDQLTVIVRYVQQSGPVERFIKFIPMFSHTGSDIANIIIDFMGENDIDIGNCRGQSYDNAANMSGKYNGVQAIIREKCSVAYYVPCTANSLNLVGKFAAESCPVVVCFFDLLQRIYVWLVASTHRWQVHRKHLKGLPVHKALSGTRWSARYDAVRAMNRGYENNLSALKELASDENQTRDSRLEAEGFLKKLQRLEVAILLEIWDIVLERFHRTSISLQKEGLSLNSAVHLLESLLDFVKSQREEFDSFEAKGKMKSVIKDYKESSKRPLKKKRHFDEVGSSIESELSNSEKFKVNVFLVIFDGLASALQKRLEAYTFVQGKFGFLSNLTEITGYEIQKAARILMETYPNDFEDCFPSELEHISKLFKNHSEEDQIRAREQEYCRELEMLSLLNRYNFTHSFPNVHIMLRIYLSMMISNCSGERSFSKLKRIKDELRCCMAQNRLNLLSLMSIEKDILNSLSFTDTIHEFAMMKIRKRPIT